MAFKTSSVLYSYTNSFPFDHAHSDLLGQHLTNMTQQGAERTMEKECSPDDKLSSSNSPNNLFFGSYDSHSSSKNSNTDTAEDFLSEFSDDSSIYERVSANEEDSQEEFFFGMDGEEEDDDDNNNSSSDDDIGKVPFWFSNEDEGWYFISQKFFL